MAIRPAHTVSVIKRRLEQAEAAEKVDAMELLSLADELLRVERKADENKDREGPRRRPAADPKTVNDGFRRVRLLIERAKRVGVSDLDRQAIDQADKLLGDRGRD